MKTIFLSALALLALGASAMAETIEFPSDAPVASVTYPDTWKAEETDTGVQGFSPDDNVAFYLDHGDKTNAEARTTEAVDFLKTNGVEIDPASLSQSDGTVNGFPATFLNYQGKDENGDVTIGIYFFEVSPETMLVGTNWYSKNDDDQKLSQELADIVNSIKPVGQ